jgi:hypothetical protein
VAILFFWSATLRANTFVGWVTGPPVNGSGNARYYGGSWFNSVGTLFVYRNNDYIYEINLDGPTLENSFAGEGVNSTLNDAAACAATDIVKKQVIGPEEIGIYETEATEFGFEITYSGPATLIVDIAPAEFEVTDCLASDPSTCDYYLDSDSNNPKKRVTSATIIEWAIPEPGTYTLLVTMENRLSNGNKKSVVYKPTSCGDLPLNLGAIAYEVDEDGGLVLDSEFNPIPLVASNILVVEDVAGTKPCAPVGLTVTLDGANTLNLTGTTTRSGCTTTTFIAVPVKMGPSR